MERKILYLVLLLAVLSGNCGTQKRMTGELPVETSPIAEETVESKATGDTDEYYEAVGIQYGSQVQMGELHILALRNAQQVIRQKIMHSYKGVMEDYLKERSDSIQRDLKTDLTHYGEHAINVIVGDSREVGAPQFSAMDERGNVTCTVLVRILRKEVSSRVASFLFKDGKMKEQLEEKFFLQLMNKYFPENE